MYSVHPTDSISSGSSHAATSPQVPRSAGRELGALPPLDSGLLYSELRFTPSVLRGETVHSTERTTVGVDWMRWSGPRENMQEALQAFREIVGSDNRRYEYMEPGLWFYEKRQKYAFGANVCYSSHDGRNAKTFTIEITGEGINSLGISTALEINHAMLSCGCWATRIDPCIDMHGKDLSFITDVLDACDTGKLCKFRVWQPHTKKTAGGDFISHGVSFGSREYDKYVRVYDKSLEQKQEKAHAWVRFEAELKGDIARQFAVDLGKAGGDWLKLAANTVAGTVDFRDGSRKVARSRRRRSEFWSTFLGDLNPRTYTSQRTPTEVQRHMEWLKRCVFPFMKTMGKLTGLDQCQLFDLLAKDVPAWMDAETRPLIYQYMRVLRGDDSFGTPPPPDPYGDFVESVA